jgi:putative transposase
MTQHRAARKSLAEWQAIVTQYDNSGLSANKFCNIHNIGYVSFCRWRKRIQESSEPKKGNVSAQTQPQPFIHVSDLAVMSPQQSWSITLDLGNGVQLTLNQT